MMDNPVAILTDITKAYLRVNRIMLQHILDRWSMKEKMKRALSGIHEGTEYQSGENKGIAQSGYQEED